MAPEPGPEPDFPAERQEGPAQIDRVTAHELEDDDGDDDAEDVGCRGLDLQEVCDAWIHVAAGRAWA